jgi:hypothetical protein
VARISETPAVPFKVVHLTSGMAFEGVLKSAENDDEVLLENAGRTYRVRRELIARMDQKMVEPGPWRDRTLAEARQYVTDPKGGISADVLAAVTKDLGIADKEALDVWNARLNETVAVGPDGAKAPRPEAPSHQARWGTGSWLRGTGAAGAVPPRAGGAGAGPQQQWPSPEDWWKAQPPAVKAGILRAMCAEALMKVDKVFEEPCSNCGGSGQLEVLVTGVGGNAVRKDPCPVCRGGGKFYGVTYR